MIRYAYYLICIPIDINENLQNQTENTTDILISAAFYQNYFMFSVYSVIQIEKAFHLGVLYENCPICIFMSINENLNQMTNGPVNAHLTIDLV